MTVYEIVETPFSGEHYEGELEIDPYLEVSYAWQDQRFIYGHSPLAQRMMLVPALVGMVLVLLGLFVVPRLLAGIEVQEVAAAGEGTTAVTEPQPPAAAEAETAATTGGISPVFSKEVRHWEAQIIAWSAQFGLDPDITATIMQIESCGDPNAVSSAGAQGLFQVMPFHFAAGEVMQDPDTNAFRGLKFYDTMLKHTGGNIFLSFAGYNGGYRASDNPYSTWPRETQRYYYWSQGIYEEAKAGKTSSDRLAEWMAAGGAGLCRQAANRLGI
jgi:soluble lytic murein transglycosylase-like protein